MEHRRTSHERRDEMPKFRFHITKTMLGNTEVHMIQTVALVDDNNVLIGRHHRFPANLQPIQNHPELAKLPLIKSRLKNLVNYGNVSITLPDDELNLYYNDGNFIFKDNFLDECEDPNEKLRASSAAASAFAASSSAASSNNSNAAGNLGQLLERIKELESKLDTKKKTTVKKARDNFAISEFDGKGDGADYLKKFETECDRYEIRSEEDKIKILGDFCKKSAATWYETSEKVLDKDWKAWTESFKAAFGQKGWTPVRSAHHYRWLKGSLKDYALEKHRLIAEIDNNIPAKTLIDMIVVGCPSWVQKELKRGELADMNKLYEALQRIDDPKSNQTGTFKDYKESKSKPEEKPKESCQWCAKLGFPKRKHTTEECNMKRRAMQNAKKVNLVDGSEDDAAFLKLINAESDSES